MSALVLSVRRTARPVPPGPESEPPNDFGTGLNPRAVLSRLLATGYNRQELAFTLAIESLAAREVILLTYDTGQATRGRAAGLNLVKRSLPLGDEPDTRSVGRRRTDRRPEKDK
jgi:hypothetical protein